MAEVKEEIRNKLEDRCKELEDENNKLTKHASGQATLQGAKHLIRDMIIPEETKLRTYLDFIHNKESATQEAKNHIQITKMDLNKRPMDAAEVAINFLNSLTKEDIRWGNFQDIILVITWAKILVHRHRHLNMVKAKWNFMHKQVDEFASFFNALVKRGIPFFWEEKGPMMS